MKAKRTLVFKYQHEERTNDAKRLSDVLRGGGFPFVVYDNGAYYLFKVQKAAGKTWNDTMHTINEVHAPVYRYDSAIIENGNEYNQAIVIR